MAALNRYKEYNKTGLTQGEITMPSPFPGMNPWLENPRIWPNFYNSLITYARDELNNGVGDNYFVSIEEQIYIHELPSDQWRSLGRADVAVSRVSDKSQQTASSAAVAAPHRAVFVENVDTVSLPYLEIRDRLSDEVVTIIEILSPSNKRPGSDWDQYARKRLQIGKAKANFVEIDLLRGGRRHTFASGFPACDYYAMVFRPSEWPNVGIWPVRLRERLPVVPIPLREGDLDVSIDLQELLHRAYDSAGYAKVIYQHAPEPLLSAEDAEWAKQFLPAKPQGYDSSIRIR
jgi:hypothetical protein